MLEYRMEPKGVTAIHFLASLKPTMGGISSGVIKLAKNMNASNISSIFISFGNTKNDLISAKSLIEQVTQSGSELFMNKSLLSNNYGLGSFKLPNQICAPDINNRFVIIHQIYSLSTLYGYRYAKRFNLAFAIFPHGSLSDYHETRGWIKKFLAKKLFINRALKRSSAIIVTALNEYNELPIYLKSKAVYLPYSAETRNSDFAYVSKQNKFVFVGRFHQVKNLPMLIRAIHIAKFAHPDIHLEIAGSGSKRELKVIKKEILKFNLSSSITLHGWLSQDGVKRLIESSKALILPSSYENFGQVVTEALALGTPCIVSSNVGAAHLISKYKAGIVLNELTDDAIASAIDRILASDQTELRASALNSVNSELNWATIMPGWVSLLKSEPNFFEIENSKC